MRSRSVSRTAMIVSSAGLALFLSACADSTAPNPAVNSSPSAVVVPVLPPIPGTSTGRVNLASDLTTQYCGFNSTLSPIASTSFGTCGLPVDLTGALALYNPGWPVAMTGSSWIGPVLVDGSNSVGSGTANEYKPDIGTYNYITTFNVPAGASNPMLNLSVRSDNAVIVYLNGVKIGQNPITDCDRSAGPCNWDVSLLITDASAFVAGTNTLRFDVVDVPTDFGFNPPTTCKLPPDNAVGHYVIPYDFGHCPNPTGLDFVGTVSFAPAPPPHPVALFVIGDVEAHDINNVVNFWGAQWWKNNMMSGTVSNGVASFKGYATTSDNVCGGTWQSLPGNSSNPPATIPADVAIIVTSKVIKNGPNISGDIKQIVMVHQDGGYGPNPGHDGNGPVTSIVCTAH
jgi:hypothetical protein